MAAAGLTARSRRRADRQRPAPPGRATDTFVGNVSAVVTHVTPEGNLIIDGERRVRINGEDDLLVVSGVVRPQDINSSNQVPSSSVANLRLALTGQGQVRDQQGFGWGERILSWVWPF